MEKHCSIKFLSAVCNLLLFLGKKIDQNPYCSIVWVKFDDVTVSSLIVVS